MNKGVIGRKIGMTGIFTSNGDFVPVTVIQAGPCFVTQIKTIEKDGYNALQMGFSNLKEKHSNKALDGHFSKSGGSRFKVLKEFRIDNPTDFSLGQEININMFEVNKKVHITGITKGRGFAGVIKRHGFHRGPKTHGSRSYRTPGSIGASATPSRVFKGKKMPGHYGVDRKTEKNLKIVEIRPKENLIFVKGAVPGFNSSILEVRLAN